MGSIHEIPCMMSDDKMIFLKLNSSIFIIHPTHTGLDGSRKRMV
jgi:hypothetical protein